MSFAIEFNGSRLNRQGEYETVSDAKNAARSLTQRDDLRDLVIRAEGGNTTFKSGRAVSQWSDGEWIDLNVGGLAQWWSELNEDERAAVGVSSDGTIPQPLVGRFLAAGGELASLAPARLKPDDQRWIAEQGRA